VTQAVNGVTKTGIVNAAFLSGYEMRRAVELAPRSTGSRRPVPPEDERER